MTADDRPVLRIVRDTSEREHRWQWFCGHCAASFAQAPAPGARVCPSCGLGVLLESREDAVPQPGDAFVVIDSALLVHAMSERAEAMLGVSEELAVNRPVGELLSPADAETQRPSDFAAAVTAAMCGEDPVQTFVRPWNTFGVRMRARVSPCGPPRAALVVLDTPPTRLRVVPR